MIHKFKLFSDSDCRKILELISTLELEDGKSTAGSFVRDIKNNHQITAKTEKSRNLLSSIEAHLFKSPAFRLYAYPKKFVRSMINVHSKGEYYGAHVDNTYVINDQSTARGDLSYTIFLEDPSRYEGGELKIRHELSDVSVKLSQGEGVLYDSGLIHEVVPVRSGTRISFVGWVESWIPDSRIRGTLSALDKSIGRLKTQDNLSREEQDELHRIYNELLRAHMR